MGKDACCPLAQRPLTFAELSMCTAPAPEVASNTMQAAWHWASEDVRHYRHLQAGREHMLLAHCAWCKSGRAP